MESSMMTDTTPAARLTEWAKAAEELAAKASLGPWEIPEYDKAKPCMHRMVTVERTPDLYTQIVPQFNGDVPTAEFIAASRSLVPALARAVVVLSEALEWYGDEGNWAEYDTDVWCLYDHERRGNPDDLGHRARTALTAAARELGPTS